MKSIIAAVALTLSTLASAGPLSGLETSLNVHMHQFCGDNYYSAELSDKLLDRMMTIPEVKEAYNMVADYGWPVAAMRLMNDEERLKMDRIVSAMYSDGGVAATSCNEQLKAYDL